ncbi:toxic anion resistance protein [Anaerobacillus isosaccharinicus]|uniref:Toxic anion resistance protein n=1 Tax=Anaerobacillus isosaccharinicus TaxID=1532552 RepID=A0A1S2MD52_9BACI|nr:toxic anion resistance protein [Anaerobacillus isosaccharinicus]MBA5585937.1 toxic anion resistance protein [Anaerobacillus isosaccharinicus]QOY35776.1 toxic anion resistance protein [Anaerobacillus isosaccharinicus]
MEDKNTFKLDIDHKVKEYFNPLNNEEDVNRLLERLNGLGTEAQKNAGESLEALKRPVKEMMDQPNNELPKNLLKLREIVAELEPSHLRKGQIQGFMDRLLRRNPMEQYARKYKTVESQVDNIIGALLVGKDKLQEDTVMLHQLKEVAISRIHGLNEQIEVGKTLNTMLEAKMSEEDWADKKTALVKGQQKVISRIKNMSQAVLVLQQSLASVDLIVENNEKLEEAIFNAITMTKNIITVTASIQLALGNQKTVIDAVKNVNEATEAMLLSNAQMLKSNTEETLKMLEEPAIAIETFRKAYEDVYSAIKITESSNERIIESGKKFILELDELNTQMKQKLLD